MNELTLPQDEQRISSLEIAKLAGKQHKDVLKAIRNMEPAWVEIQGRNFSLLQKNYHLPNGGTKQQPYYALTKTECLFVATKFNDQARARLVLRWEQLERERMQETLQETLQRAGQKMLMTEEEMALVTDAKRQGQIATENKDADDCFTASELAYMLGMSVKHMNRLLVKGGIIRWKDGCYQLTEEYADDLDLVKYRTYHYYTLDGEKRERKYMVWTMYGVDWVRTTRL